MAQAETCSGLEKVSFCPAPRASMATSTTSAIMAKAIAPASATSRLTAFRVPTRAATMATESQKPQRIAVL